MHLVGVGLGQVGYGEVTGFLDGGYPLGGNTHGGIGGLFVAFLYLLGTHLREEEHLLYGGLAGHQHHEAVHADTHTRRGGHAVFEGADEVVVDEHGFVVTFLREAQLLFEAQALVDGVVQFGVGVAQLLAVDHELEALGQLGVVAVTLGEGRHLDGIVGDEGRLYVVGLALLAEDFVDDLALAHGLVDLYAYLLAHLAQLCFVHAADVDAGVLLDGVEHGDALEGRLEADDVVAHLDLVGTVHVDANLLEHLLGEVHHPVIVLVRDVNLHTGKLGVVGAVHTLVAEVLGELVYPLEAAHDEAFEVELVGNTQVERNVEGVVVRDEGPGGGTAGNRLQNRGLDLQIAAGVEILAHRGVDLRTFDENIFYSLVYYQVDVALAVTQFGVFERVVGHAVFHLDDRQRAQRFGEYRQFLGVYGDFARLCAEYETADTHEVANIEQLLEYRVVQLLIFAGAKVVARDIYLDAAHRVLQLDKRGLAHDAAAHDAAGDRYLTGLFGTVDKIIFYFLRVSIYRIFGCGIGLDAHFAQLVQTVAANDLLFAQIENIHRRKFVNFRKNTKL